MQSPQFLCEKDESSLDLALLTGYKLRAQSAPKAKYLKKYI